MAIQILDGIPLRPGGKIPMTVSQAKFEQKGKYKLILNFSILNDYADDDFLNDYLFIVWDMNFSLYHLLVCNYFTVLLLDAVLF